MGSVLVKQEAAFLNVRGSGNVAPSSSSSEVSMFNY